MAMHAVVAVAPVLPAEAGGSGVGGEELLVSGFPRGTMEPEEKPDPLFEEIAVWGMCQNCEHWLARALLPGETVAKYLVGYRAGRSKAFKWWQWVLFPIILYKLFLRCFASMCCKKMVNREIDHERVCLALTSNRRILHWVARQTGSLGAGGFCSKTGGSRVVCTTTELAAMQLDAVTGMELGYQRRSRCCRSRANFTAEMTLHFGEHLPRCLSVYSPVILTSNSMSPYEIRSLWDAFADTALRGADPAKTSSLATSLAERNSGEDEEPLELEETGEEVDPEEQERRKGFLAKMAQIAQFFKREKRVSDTSTFLRVWFNQDFARSNGPTAFAALLEFEAAMLGMSPGALGDRRANVVEPMSGHFNTSDNVDQLLVQTGTGPAKAKAADEIYVVNAPPRFVALGPNERILDAHGFELANAAVIVSSHRVLEVCCNGIMDVDSPQLLFTKRWFLMERTCKGVVCVARPTSVEAFVMMEHRALRLAMTAPEAKCCGSDPIINPDRRSRVMALVSRFQHTFVQDVLEVSDALVVPRDTVEQELPAAWQSAGVSFFPGEKVVGIAHHETVPDCCAVLCGCGPPRMESTLVLTSMRTLAVVHAQVKNDQRHSAVMSYWSPISELTAFRMAAVHDIREQGGMRNGYSAVEIQPHAMGGFPVRFYSETPIPIVAPGPMDDSPYNSFFYRMGYLSDLAYKTTRRHGQRIVHVEDDDVDTTV